MIRKLLVLILCILFMAIGINGAYGYFFPAKNIDQVINDDNKDEAKVVGRVNVVFMGIDERIDDDGRTDTLFVVMYDSTKDQAAMLSIPRDTRVRISNHGWDKINHAYSYGGVLTTVSTVEKFLGINVDYYVKVDIKGFKKMIDAIDGIEIDVEKRMYYEDPWDDDGLVIDLKPGLQKLNGQQAMEYVRYRDEDGDIGRVKRQQKFINAVYAKVLSPSMVVKIPSLVQVAFDSVDTNMNLIDMFKIANSLKNTNKATLEAYSVPGEPIYIQEISYWFPDVISVRKEVAKIMGLSQSKGFASSSRNLAQVYEDSLPYDVEREGFVSTNTEQEIRKEKDKKDVASTSKKDLIDGLESQGTNEFSNNKDKLELENTDVDRDKQPDSNKKPDILDDLDSTVKKTSLKIDESIKTAKIFKQEAQVMMSLYKAYLSETLDEYSAFLQSVKFKSLNFFN